jgi:hypothetical protein
MPDQFESALAEIVAARNRGALPLTFSADATAEQNARSDGQLRLNLPKINGGWDDVRDGVTHIAMLVGEAAKAIALFQNREAAVITKEQAAVARFIAERACRLTVAGQTGGNPDDVGVSQGIVCG